MRVSLSHLRQAALGQTGHIAVRRSLPVFPEKRTISEPVGVSEKRQQETHAVHSVVAVSASELSVQGIDAFAKQEAIAAPDVNTPANPDG
jgi:hypothetical protein